ncbi:MAG: hypothetical protein EON93_04065 [Burkholderiales bacterium]|nr:MAG: hypothetical protein EON93_04065 [Burkholderiales bacterium]
MAVPTLDEVQAQCSAIQLKIDGLLSRGLYRHEDVQMVLEYQRELRRYEGILKQIQEARRS